jgi:hypothetical protein
MNGVTRINGEKVGSMGALIRRGSRRLFLDLFDLLDPLDALHLWFGGLALRIEDGIHESFCRRVTFPESTDEADIQAAMTTGLSRQVSG